MISHDRPTHKFRGFPVALAALLLAAILLAGCGGDSAQESSAGKTDLAARPQCDAAIDLSGWEAFQALGDRALQGQEIPESDLVAFGNHPVIALWRESMTERVPSAAKVGNWVEGAFWEEIGHNRPRKYNADRVTFGGAMRFSYDQRDQINGILEKFQSEGHLCQFDSLAKRWLDPEKLPDPLVVRFVASKPELRSHFGQLVADTGLLMAGGPKQTSRQLVSILYRDRQALPGPSPLEVEGRQSVAQTFRIMMNEGIAAWIDDMPHTHFSTEHPRLGKVTFVPENIYTIGIRGMDIFNTNLPRMLADPAAMTKSGQGLGRAITGAGAFTQGGYCMAAVIVHHLGEDRLLAVKNSPPAFVAAFQEAALLNPLPLPIPGAIGVELPLTMPAFSDEVFQGLMPLLKEFYPTS